MSARNLEVSGGEALKVGVVAHATGITVRTLHHYDSIGLLPASHRTAAGHRQYSADDVARLYQIQLLRRLDFSLAEISRTLDDPQWEIQKAIERHLRDTEHRLTVANRLYSRLTAMTSELSENHSPSTGDLLSTLEEMTMLDPTVHSTTSLLVYDDIEAAQEYIVRAFGLAGGDLERDDSGSVRHGEVRAGNHVIWLHPAGDGFHSPRTVGGVTGMTVVVVEDVDEHYKSAVAAGAQIIEEPVDQDYGVREYGAQDLEGQLWFFHSPLNAEPTKE